MNHSQILSEESYDIYDYDMSFRFRWIQESDDTISSFILSQPDYHASQDQSEKATERKLVDGFYKINNANTATSLNDAKMIVDSWCKRTAHAIVNKKPNTLLQDDNPIIRSPQNENDSIDNIPIDEVTDFEEIYGNVENTDKHIIIEPNKLKSKLNQNIYGQEIAIEGLSNTIARHISRKTPSKPAVVFSTGPSGVGKTRTATQLVNVLNEMIDGVEYHFLRLDMSEYQEAHRVSQLIGSPQGYLGHGTGSELVSTLRSNPKTIVLFDEIEKAHPNILKLLMNMIDAGRLSSATDSDDGYQIDCTHAILIFTSNLDASGILQDITNKNATQDMRKQDEIARNRLTSAGIPKEIIGRMGICVVYQPIADKSRAQIVVTTIQEVANEFNIKVNYIAPSIVSTILNQQSSNSFGARMDRVRVEDMLADVFIDACRNNLSTVKVVDNPIRCEDF